MPDLEFTDCIVIGAGPAGLTAALYLNRFHREVTVLDAGNSRARWIPQTRNCPGFPDGLSGDDLLKRLRTQATLAIELGASVDKEDKLVVTADQMTSIDGLYAIGDVVSALSQISVAVGHAAVAATTIHNVLPRNVR